MKLPVRTRSSVELPGVTGPARIDRRTRALLPRLRPGDIAVLDHLDLDRGTAQAMVDAGVAAVVNASPMISGRYPNLGPELLAEAGIPMLDRAEGVLGIPDGTAVRLHDEVVYAGERAVGLARELDAATVAEQLAAARRGLVAQLETFTHNTTELLRREQDLLLHGRGVPVPATPFEDRPVVVVAQGHGHRAELAAIAAFIREQRPVLVGVDRAADTLREAGHQPDIVVLSDGADDAHRPSAKTLRSARDVVVRVTPGARMESDLLERLGVRPLRLETGAPAADAALILADAGEPSVIVGVGMRATLEQFLDPQRPGLASTYLTRLRVGHRLVDATAVPTLYSGRIRPVHVLLVLLAGLVALAAAIAVTPVGQEWTSDLIGYLRGLSP